MKRFIDKKLLNWKTSELRKPLILRGARQVGKTYSVLQFGKNHFSGNVHVIDFEKNLDVCPIFENNLNITRILAELELFLNASITPGEDLLFFDEIQNCPRALMALRYFYEDLPELHVIAAGSLLEFALKAVSFPVGRVQFMEMYPLTFNEFLWATGKEKLVKLLTEPEPTLSETAHRLLLQNVKKYFLVGGMPEAVRVYSETQNYKRVFEIQEQLIDTFRQDFSKYAPFADKRCLNAVLLNTARSVGQRIKYNRLAEGFTSPTIKRAFDLLQMARIVYKIPAASPAGLPLGASANERKFKASFLDIGLMQFISGIKIHEEFNKEDLLAIYNGALAEQFVAQQLIACNKGELYFWAREAKSSSAEVDFLTVSNGQICPIEVKSGKAGRLKSLHLLLKEFPNVPMGYVCSSQPFAELPEQRLKFIPLYAVESFFL
ncbi:nuclease [candidate division KSB1 bacterium]|nr:MAG: nuclease [candidate division KSB1 bacterium]